MQYAYRFLQIYILPAALRMNEIFGKKNRIIDNITYSACKCEEKLELITSKNRADKS